ncbi:MAG TPA: HD domain-containing protein [Candidatus Saccharimonadales bacterium]|nr:HD domain-containing protein [Candidatus Saccharimonadales bacterium]
MTDSSSPSTAQLLHLTKSILIPLLEVERTMVLPFNHNRHENVGEHSYMLATLGCALAPQLDSSLDTGKIAQFALVHDLVEIYAGDTSVWANQTELQHKPQREHAAAKQIAQTTKPFPWVSATIQEYELKDTPESCFVYALDKILPHMLIIIGDHHPIKPHWDDYLRTEEVALQKIAHYPKLLPYFQEFCDTFRASPHFFANTKKD